MLEMRDVHWLAGLLEGEGSFGMKRRSENGPKAGPRAYTSPFITVGMTDRDVVERAHRLLGAGDHAGKRPRTNTLRSIDRGRHKRFYVIALGGARAVGWMMLLHPLMGSRRQAKIREVLQAWRASHLDAWVINTPRCHPERERHAHGLCLSCYRKARRVKRTSAQASLAP